MVNANTSSQGPHIGMYKAAAQQPLLGCILHQKSEIPYLSGYSLRRHRTGTDVMLPKQIMVCKRPSHHFTTSILSEPYLQSYRKRRNDIGHRYLTNPPIKIHQTKSQCRGLLDQPYTGILLTMISTKKFLLILQ